jgi:SAM-dependent methyltransferase
VSFLLNNYDGVADLYDALVRVDQDLPFWVSEATGVTSILELMAGTGRVSVALAACGTPLTCVDISQPMLQKLASKFGASIRPQVVCADVRALPLWRHYDLVLIPFNAFAEIITSADQRQVLREVWQALMPGGRFVCVLHNPGVRIQSLDGEPRVLGTCDLGEGERLVVTAAGTVDRATGIACSHQTFSRKAADGHLLDELTQEVRFALITRRGFETLAEKAGFEVVAFFGNYDRSQFDPDRSPFMLWVLRRPAGAA